MAGKPEQPSTLPAPLNHAHRHQHQQAQHHHQQQQLHQQAAQPQQQQQQQQPGQVQHQQHQQQHHHHHHHPAHHPQESQQLQQNSVLVYVSGENFAYATAVGQNAAAAAAAAATAVSYQSPQQATYAAGSILPAQVPPAAPSASFPAKTAVYCSNETLRAAGNSCCRLKSLEYADGDPTRNSRTSLIGAAEDDEDYGTIVANNAMLYGQPSHVQPANQVNTAMQCVVGSRESKNLGQSGVVESEEQKVSLEMRGEAVPPGKLFPSRMHGDGYQSGRLTEGYNGGAVGVLGEDGCVAYVSQQPATGDPSQSGVFVGEGIEQSVGMDDKSRQQQHQDVYDNQAGSSLSSTSSLSSASSSCSSSSSVSNIGVSGVVVGGGSSSGVVVVGVGGAGSCDSVRSDAGESSAYSSLSSPESQSQPAHEGGLTSGGPPVNPAGVGGVGVGPGGPGVNNGAGGGSCAQQAARLTQVPRVNNSNNNNSNAMQQNVVLAMNGGAVVTQQQQQQQQQHQHQHQLPAITVPRGWKRICTNGVIIYISPSSTALGSLDQLKEYLTTVGTCKCGLECPLRPEQVFNFDPKVATRPWSPDQGKTREMTKLCNHKRKLLLPTTAAASPVASCTTAVSSSTLSSAPSASAVHANVDSPASPDKARKDGLSKKKKRKLGGIGGIYSGVSVSQLLAQRERAIAAVTATGVQGPPIPNGSQVWPIAIPNLQVQQNNQQVCHQTLSSPSQTNDVNGCATRNPQQRLSQQNMSGMLMGNSLIMNQQGTNFNNMTQQQQQLLQQQHQQLLLQQQQQQQQQLLQQHISQQQQQQQQVQPQQLIPHHQQVQHMQILQQQQEHQEHENTVVNQFGQQQAAHYINQLNQQQLNVMQQQQEQLSQQQQQQQLHMQQIQKHNMQQQQLSQEVEQQQSGNYTPQHTPDVYVHHMQQSQVPQQPTLHPQMHQLHQHQLQQQPQQQQSNQHVMQAQSADQFQMQLQQLQQQQQQQQQQQHQQISQICVQQQYSNPQLGHHVVDVMQQQTAGTTTGLMNANEMPRQNRAPSVTEEDLNAKQMQQQQHQQQQQQQILAHNHTVQRHHIMQNGTLQNNPHETVQRMYTQNQIQYPPRNFEAAKANSLDGKMNHQQQYNIQNMASRSPNPNHTVEVQSAVGPNGQTGNVHFSTRTPAWQQNRPASGNHQPSVVTVQNITCNSFDRVPPLHHHIPQASTWPDEVARKKAKSGKVIVKKQRQHNDARSNNNLDQSAASPIDEYSDKNQQSNGHIGSTVNGSGPSFLEDPSGYLAQQTALLNSTISRQTGVSSTQMGIGNSNPKTPQTSHATHVPNTTYISQPKPSSGASPTSTSAFNSVKNHATSPVVVHSSMTPTSSSGGTDSESSPCQGCVTSADTQYAQDQYKQQVHRQYLIQSDQREDPVTSSTFGERYQSNQQQADSRPIQGGTVSTSHGSPIGTNSPANSDIPAAPTTPGISQPATPQSLISSQPSTPHSYSQPSTPHSHPASNQIPPQPLTPQAPQPSQSSMGTNVQELRSETPSSVTTSSSGIPPSTSPSQTSAPTLENLGPQPAKRQATRQQSLEGYQPHPHAVSSVSRVQMHPFSTSSVITTMASGHTVSSNTITSVLAGRANTATVSINTPSAIPNSAIPNILSNKPQHPAISTSIPTVPVTTVTPNPTLPTTQPSMAINISKSPLEMVQSVVSSIQVPQASTSSPVQPQNHQPPQQPPQHPQSNVQVHNVLTSGGILKHPAGSALPPGHILVSSGGQLIMASTGSGINGVMAPPPPKIISNANSMPPLSVSPMVTSVTGAVSQVIPAVGVAQQVIGQPTVLVNTIQTPVLIQPGMMTMDSIGQNVQIPHLTVATGNVIQNAQSLIDANQEVTRSVNASQTIVNRQPALLSPELSMSKKKAYKKRKTNPQTVSSMLHIASSQQNAGMLMQSQSNFAQQNFQTQSIGGPMLQALTIVPGKGGAPAQLVMNGQASAASAQFNAHQIVTNPQPTQQINLLQPVNLLNGATGMVQNFPTIQQFIVPGIGSMVMSADGTATLLQDTGNIGMQLQIQNVNGQNVLTPVQSHSGIFNPSQSILAAGPAGMVIRAPQATGGKIIQQHSPGAQFLSPNSGQFLVNGTTSFGNQLSPIVANVSPNQQVTFNTSQVRPSNMQGQQEFIQMNGQTLMVPCGTAQNIAVSSAANHQNTTFVQQNTTIVQQQTTMVSNNQIPNFQAAASNGGATVDPSLNLDHGQSYILNSGMIQGKAPNSPKSSVTSPGSEQSVEQQQYVLASSSTTVVEKSAQQSEQHSPLMARHSVSTQTAGNQANVVQSAMMRQGSPPDTTTHSPGNSQRSNSPAVDTTTHGAASPAPPITARHHSSSTPMVHCVSSSEPDTGEVPVASEDWRIQGITTKEITLSQPGLHGKTYVESTVTTGIQIYTSETLKQAEGVVSTVRCEGRDHALGRGIKRKLDSIHSMHSTLHEDQDESTLSEEAACKSKSANVEIGVSSLKHPVPEGKSEMTESDERKLEVGELVWGAARGSPAWPGKVESLGPPGTRSVWVRWYGGGGTRSQVEVKALKSLSEGLEAHHRARKKYRKSRKLNMQLENAIQEAMTELDKMSEAGKDQKQTGNSRRVTSLQGSRTVGSGTSKPDVKRSPKKTASVIDISKAEQKQSR